METAVITTGGLGTRLLTFTKSNPKTMLPLYEKSRDKSGGPLVRPLLEIIFENLYDVGIRRFCIIVGTKTQEAILRQMMPDPAYISLLQKRNVAVDRRFIRTLSRLYSKMEKCTIKWIPQSTPMGFGHALLSSSKFIGKDDFLLHAGDAYFPSVDFIPKMIKRFQADNMSAVLLLQRMKSLKGYGIAQMQKSSGQHVVFHVQEKPKKPQSNLAILPVYLFRSEIFNALRKTQRGYNNELQVTDAVKTLIDWNKKVSAELYTKNWFDIGSPENYYKALNYSYKNSL